MVLVLPLLVLRRNKQGLYQNLEADESQSKRYKTAESGSKEKDDSKSKVEQSTSVNTGEGSPKQTKDSAKLPEASKQDYIHVRARRGQATDSHSLAERVRREKISERMKFLQDLVPGCSKVTGKAVMLDEIINYVQSLQRQVEMIQSRGSSPRMLFASDTTAVFTQLHQPQQGPMQVGVTCGTEGHGMGIPVEAALRRTMNAQPPCIDGYGDANSQIANPWDDELQSVVQMGFGQNRQTPFKSQGFHGSLPTSHMKIEL